MHHPITESVLLVAILISVISLPLEAILPEPAATSAGTVGDVLTGVFVLELMARFAIARRRSRFVRRYWIDILSVVPVIRPLRLFRVLRVLRLMRAGVLAQRRTSGGIFAGDTGVLTTLGAASVVIVVTASQLLMLSEAPYNPDLQTVERALWFSVYSLVGGEPIGAVPATTLGRWITLGVMVGGLTVFGVFVGTVSALVASRLSRTLEVHDMDIDELDGHTVVLGWNRSGSAVLQEVMGPHTPLDRALVVVTEGPRPEDMLAPVARGAMLYHLRGDYTRVEILEEAGILRAERVILLTDDQTPRSDQDRDARTVLAALTIERMNPTIFTVAELTSSQSVPLLEMAGVEEIVIGDWYAGAIMGSAARTRGLVGVLRELLTTTEGSSFFDVEVPTRCDGKTVGELHSMLLADHQAVLVAVESARGHEVNPAVGRKVRVGERLVVLSRGRPRL